VAATGGTDLVYSYLSTYTLGTNVENGRILATGAANLTGNTLNNLLYAGAGNNSLNGSTGTDTVSYAYGLSGTTGVTVSLALATAQVTGGSGTDTLISIENLTGSELQRQAHRHQRCQQPERPRRQRHPRRRQRDRHDDRRRRLGLLLRP
jgi:hypothetical protein